MIELIKRKWLLTTITTIAIVLLLFQDFILRFLLNWSPNPIYSGFAYFLFFIHGAMILLMIFGSITAITGWLMKRSVLLESYLVILGVTLVGSIISVITGTDCFLTALEKVFRYLGGLANYTGGFIDYNLNQVGFVLPSTAISSGFAVLFTTALVSLYRLSRNQTQESGITLRRMLAVTGFLLAITVALVAYRQLVVAPQDNLSVEFSAATGQTLMVGTVAKIDEEVLLVADVEGRELELLLDEKTYYQLQKLDGSVELVGRDEVEIGEQLIVRYSEDNRVLSILMIEGQQ